MPTDDERREVARRLRAIDYDALKESLICVFLDAIGETGYLDWVGVAHRLADLIEPEPERTCRVKSVKEIDDYDGITFGEAVFTCGHSAEFVYCRPDYCPTCGARVVD